MSESLANLDKFLELIGPNADAAKAQAILDLASNRFRGDVHHYVSHVEDDVVTLDGDGTRILLLPQAPVTDVAEVKVGDDVVDVEWSEHGILRWSRCFPDRLRAIQVTYSHGYAPDKIPGDIVDVVLDRAHYAYTRSAPGLSSLQVGGQTLSWSAAVAEGLTEEWRKVVEAHRLNRGEDA